MTSGQRKVLTAVPGHCLFRNSC